MNLTKTLMASTALTLAAGMSYGQEMADEMTIFLYLLFFLGKGISSMMNLPPKPWPNSAQ